MTDVARETLEIITKRAGANGDAVNMDAKLKDLGLESLNAIEMVMDLEEKFDINIPFNVNDTEAKDFETVGDIVRAIEKLVAEKT
jgi:acyl carrier protein